MEEAGGREYEESRVEDRESCRSNEMERKCESDCGGDEVYPATFSDDEKTGLKLDGDDDSIMKADILRHSITRQQSWINYSKTAKRQILYTGKLNYNHKYICVEA